MWLIRESLDLSCLGLIWIFGFSWGAAFWWKDRLLIVLLQVFGCVLFELLDFGFYFGVFILIPQCFFLNLKVFVCLNKSTDNIGKIECWVLSNIAILGELFHAK